MNKSGVMKLLIIIVSLCVLAVVSVGVYSLMKKPNTTEEPSTVSSSSIEPTATQESENQTTSSITQTTPSETSSPETPTPTITETTTVETTPETPTPTPKPATPKPTKEPTVSPTPKPATVTPTIPETTATEAWMEAKGTSTIYDGAMQERADNGYESIPRSATLDALAQGRAEELALLGEINHNNMPNEANWEGLRTGIGGGAYLYWHCADGFAATTIGIGAATYHRADGSTYSVTCMLLKE